jgi:hypothetical protein
MNSTSRLDWLAIDDCGGKLDLQPTSKPLNDRAGHLELLTTKRRRLDTCFGLLERYAYGTELIDFSDVFLPWRFDLPQSPLVFP